MKKVYIVMGENEHESSSIVAVYDNEDKARECTTELLKNNSYGCESYHVYAEELL